jgi:hypothetical protein
MFFYVIRVAGMFLHFFLIQMLSHGYTLTNSGLMS